MARYGNGRELATAGHGGGGSEVVIDGEVTEMREAPGALEALTRAEIDTQINTARRFPRSPARFLSEARGLATIDPEIARDCTYALKRGGKTITGPSVRLAEICAYAWGNLRTSARVVGEDFRWVTAQAIALDLERNVGFSVEVKRRITNARGDRYGDDMIGTTSNAATSIALRNAIFRTIPRAFVDLVWHDAQACAAGDLKGLAERRATAIDYFVAKGVPEAEVLAALGVSGVEDVTLDHLVVLQGFRTAYRDGEASLADLFRPPLADNVGPPVKRSAALAERLAAPAPKAAPEPKPLYSEAEPEEEYPLPTEEDYRGEEG